MISIKFFPLVLLNLRFRESNQTRQLFSILMDTALDFLSQDSFSKAKMFDIN